MAEIAMIHATRAAISPVETAFAEIWPDASHWSLLDEGLTQAVDRAGDLTDDISARFIALGEYAAAAGSDALLFTCTAFGPPMEACQQKFDFPVLKPNDAMMDKALAIGGQVGLLASHPVTLPMLSAQFEEMAADAGIAITLHPKLAEGAWADLQAGRREAHDSKLIEAAAALSECDCVMLAQFSMAPLKRATEAVVEGEVLSSPHAAVEKLKALLAG